MSLTPAETERLREAGLHEALVRAADAEAARMAHLRVERLYCGVKGFAIMAATVFILMAGASFLIETSWRWGLAFGVVTALPPRLAAIPAMLANQTLRRRDPARWTLRQLAQAAVSSRSDRIELLESRMDGATDWHEGLIAAAQPNPDFRMVHKVVLIGVIVVPMLSIPVMMWAAR
ncbi:hypothetical protein FKB34_00025 [Glycocaulis profundi]|nr:hypothetical protein FKB34_00025 [Glycocaulis profundi]